MASLQDMLLLSNILRRGSREGPAAGGRGAPVLAHGTRPVPGVMTGTGTPLLQSGGEAQPPSPVSPGMAPPGQPDLQQIGATQPEQIGVAPGVPFNPPPLDQGTPLPEEGEGGIGVGAGEPSFPPGPVWESGNPQMHGRPWRDIGHEDNAPVTPWTSAGMPSPMAGMKPSINDPGYRAEVGAYHDTLSEQNSQPDDTERDLVSAAQDREERVFDRAAQEQDMRRNQQQSREQAAHRMAIMAMVLRELDARNSNYGQPIVRY